MRLHHRAPRIFRLVIVGACAALSALSALGQPCAYNEVGPRFDICGTVVQQGGDGSIVNGVNFNVKYCLNPDGTFCLQPNSGGTTNSNGFYELGFGTKITSGNYFMFAWRDDIYWGSATQPIQPLPIAITYWLPSLPPYVGWQMIYTPNSLPRPLPPGLVAPPANVTVPYDQPITLQWTRETDSRRVNQGWPLVYDVYTAVTGNPESLRAANLACSPSGSCSTTLAARAFPAGSTVRWRTVAKLSHAGTQYSTSSSTFTFQTSSDFSIAVSPQSQAMYAGTSAPPFTVSTQVTQGLAEPITLFVSNLPSGVSGGFNPNPVTAGGSSTLTLTAAGNAPDSPATAFTVLGTSPSTSHTVSPPPTISVTSNDFSISISPSSQSVGAGLSTSYTVSTALTHGLAQGISLSMVSGMPGGGATSAFAPTHVTAGQSATLSISTTSSTATGSFLLTVRGTAGSGAKTATTYLIVNPPRMPIIRAIRNVPTRVVGPYSFSAQAEVSSPAPPAGLTVGLASSNSQVASVPSSVFVPGGATLSQPFTVNTSVVQASTSVTLTATYQGSTSATFYVDPPASVSIAWVQPAECAGFGPAGTLTVAGYAHNGTGTVQMYWKDRTIGGSWIPVAYTPTPDAGHVWYNTIPSATYSHTYDVYAVYSQATSPTFTYGGGSSSNCIIVTDGSYGANWGADGNATVSLAQSCNGHSTCSYLVDWHVLGDPYPGKEKNFVAKWTCGGGPLKTATLAAPPEASGRVVTLTCP